MHRSRVWIRPLAGGVLGGWLCMAAHGQSGSAAALRFYGTGVGPPGQQDRVRIRIDDDQPGNASTPLDLGAGSFTIDLWVRGTLANNSTPNAGGDVETADDAWIDGNIIIDRDIWGGGAAGERKWGVSLAGGFVRFGTSAGQAPGDSKNTIEGSTNVLTGVWRHVSVVRDAVSGVKRIYIDGAADFASSPGASNNDLSYPDAGAPGQLTPWGPYIVLAAEKHDAGVAYPSFNGWMDEVRFWNRALSAAEINAVRGRVIVSAADTAGLVGYYRFEEGAGTGVGSSTTNGAPSGELIAGIAGNGEWSLRSASVENTAPVIGACPADVDGSGVVDADDIFMFLSNWFASLGACAGCVADVNGSGAVDTDDIFAFLSLWFASLGAGGGGCS